MQGARHAPTMLYIIATTAVVIGAFVLGWVMGYKESQAHRWDASKVDHRNDTDAPSSHDD
jgi:hypothetical protein